MVETVRYLRRGLAFIHIAHGTAGNEPHHQFDALAASFTHLVNMRFLCQGCWVGNDVI